MIQGGSFSSGNSQREKLYIISRFVFAEMQSGLITPFASSTVNLLYFGHMDGILFCCYILSLKQSAMLVTL